jgi:hypothetical protein
MRGGHRLRMQVDRCGGDRAMTQILLHMMNRVARIDLVRGGRVSQPVRRNPT